MRRIGKNPDRDFSAGGPMHTEDHRSDTDLDRLASDPLSWGPPLSYVDLLTDPSVQSDIARLIVQSAIKRPRRGRS
jgi:hypothetical protein